MNKSTTIAVAMATFAFGYLQALTSQAGPAGNHPGWVFMAVVVVGASLAIETAESSRRK